MGALPPAESVASVACVLGGGVWSPVHLHFQTRPDCFKGLHPPCQRHAWQTALGWLHLRVNRQEFSHHRETSFHPGVPDFMTPSSKAKPPWEIFNPENSDYPSQCEVQRGGYRCRPGHWWELGHGPQVDAPLTYSPTRGTGIQRQVWESPGRSPLQGHLLTGSLVHVTSGWTVSLCTGLPKPP